MRQVSKYILSSILLFVACAPLWAQATEQKQGEVHHAVADSAQVGIRFEDITLKEALAKADSLGYKVFIDCYTKTCGPCKMMAKHVFPLKECGDYFNSHFVSLMRDMEEGEGVDIAKTYKVKFYPTYLILNPDGSLFCSWTGAVSMKKKETFVPLVKERIAMTEMTLEYAKGKCDEAFFEAYIPLLQKYDRKQLEKVINETLLKQDVKTWLEPKRWAIMESEAKRLEQPLFRCLLDNRKMFGEQMGADKVAGMLTGVYANELSMYRGMGVNYDLCLPDLKTLSEEGVKGADALHYAARICEAVDKKQTDRAEEVVKMIKDIATQFESNEDRLKIILSMKGTQKILTPAQKEQVSQALNGMMPAFSPADAKAAKRIAALFGN